MDTLTRTQLLELDEPRLQAICRCEACRGTGPGGQKRNKTSTAVRVTHADTGLSASDDQERSQQLNKHRALQKLRLQFALKLREAPVPWNGPVPSLKSERYVCWLAVLLDHLYACNFSMADTAAAMNSSTGKLVREMAKTPAFWQLVNAERAERGFNPLRPD